MKGYEGESFLNRIYQDLHLSEEVMHTASKSDDKEKKVRKYLERLEKVEELAKNRSPHGFDMFKELFYQKYVIKPENIPDSYFENQKKIALERGYGYVDYTEEMKKEMRETIIQDQKKSLDQWLEYFIENDAKYPEWFKYYAFQGMVKLGSYNKETRKFNKRTESTTNIFVDLNYEALALVYDSLSQFIEGKEIEEELLKKLLEGGSFSKLYSYMIQKIDSVKKDSIDSKEGIWIKYPKGSNPEELVKSIEGRGTGWCSAGLETARVQLQGGDFYIYYTKDSNGEYKQPRIAIRMENNSIGEIRGIGFKQNLESEMEEVVKEKLEEFPDKEKYYQKVEDMEKLTKIYGEYQVRELEKEELRFLYQIDHKILGFGYREDPRIQEILKDRDYQEDLSKVIGCKKEEVSNDRQDILSRKKIVCFYGKLDLSNVINDRTIQSYKDLELPEYVIGDLRLPTVTNLNGIQLPRIVRGNLDLSSLVSAQGLKFPEIVDGFLALDSLISIEDLNLPKTVNGNLELGDLKRAKGLKFPEIVNGDLWLSDLENAEDLNLPETVNGTLWLNNLKNASGLILPETVDGNLWFIRLKNAEGLVLPKTVNGHLYLSNLENAEGLVLPKIINESLWLEGLKNAKDLVLSKRINGIFHIDNLATLDGLIVPEGFSCSDVSSPYFTIQDLIDKSLEQKNEKEKIKEKTKQGGFTKVGILILINLLVSIGIIILGVILIK